MIYGDGAGAYFQRATVPSSSSVPKSSSRPHRRHGKSIRTLRILGQRLPPETRHADFFKAPIAAPLPPVAALPISADIIPSTVRLDSTVTLQYDPGATHLFTPKPLDIDALVLPYRDSLMVADGSHVPIVGTSMLGPVETFIAPSLTHALVPQAALEKLGLLSILSAGELKLYDVNTKQSQDLIQLIAQNQPACVIPFEDNQYTISTSQFQKLVVAHKTISPRVLSYAYGEMTRINADRRSLLKPPAYCRQPTRRARYLSRYSRKYQPSVSSVYYTTDIRSLRDLVLYWHIALGHTRGGEEEMIRIVQHQLITNLPEQLTVAVIRKYFRQIPRCKPCAEATLQRLPSPPSSTSPRPPTGEVCISRSISNRDLLTRLGLYVPSLAIRTSAMLSMPDLTVSSVSLPKGLRR